MQGWSPGCPQPLHGSNVGGASLRSPRPGSSVFGDLPPPNLPARWRCPGRGVQVVPSGVLDKGTGWQLCHGTLCLPRGPRVGIQGHGAVTDLGCGDPTDVLAGGNVGCMLGCHGAPLSPSPGAAISSPGGSDCAAATCMDTFWGAYPTRALPNCCVPPLCSPVLAEGGSLRTLTPGARAPRRSRHFQRTPPAVVPRTAPWGN